MNKQVTSTSLDSHLDALGHVDRRRLLLTLLSSNTDGDRPVEIDQMEYDTAERPLELSMYHVHLPKLEEKGLVDADADTHSVTRGPRFDEIKPLLELLDANREQLPDGWV